MRIKWTISPLSQFPSKPISLRGLSRWITAFLVLFSLRSAAQYDPYRFSRLDISQGLSHNEVNSLLRDENGFLWIGTMSGLNRYDGYTFRAFRHDLRDTTSISDDYIERIYEGPSHKLWIFTHNGINLYDPQTEKFDRRGADVLGTLHIPNGNVGGSITDIKKDSLGNYWFLSATTGLYKYEPSTGRTTRFFHRKGDGSSLYSNSITSMSMDIGGNWWLVYRDGMMEKMEVATGRIVTRIRALKDQFPADSVIYHIFVDRQNDCWLYASGSPIGVLYYNASTGALRHIEKDGGKTSLNTNIVTGILQDDKGLIWIATDHGGINLLDKKDFSIRYMLNREYDDKTIGQNSITALYLDKEGIVWVGTFKKGISYHQDDIMKFPLYRHRIPNAPNQNYDDVNRFVEDPKGNLWIGTNGGGLLYFNRRTGHFTQWLHNPADPASLANDVIVSLCLDHEQKLWIGTYYGGLDCFDGKKFKHYRHDPKDTGSIADDRIWEILEDSRHKLWIGTFSEGLDRLDRTKNVFKHYKPFTPNSVYNGYIMGLMEDHHGNIWIATAYGIDVLERASGRFVHYGHDTNHPGTSLSNDNTVSTCEDERGLIWVATREGLNVFDPVTGLFTIFRTEDGLPDNTIVDILEDNSHNLWLSTPNGLSNAIVTMDTATRRITCRFRNYDESDGLQGREFNENAAFKTSAGELIFGGANGFNLFDPLAIRHDNRSRPLILTDLRVFNTSVKIGEPLNGHIILQQSITTTKEITLRYNENVFSIEFAALDLSTPEKVKYAYRLEGFNQQWLVSNDKTRRATFTNLDPGDYTFKVRTANDKGGWNPEELALNIRILPPFWKTPLAYTIYGLLLIGALILGRRMILQRAHMRFALEQERKEAHRLHELDRMKTRFFTNVSHEFRTPLSLILAPLDKIIRQTRDAGQQQQLHLIHRNARRLLNMVNQLLDFRKLEMQELRLNPGQGDIVKFIKELSFSFTDMAGKKNIDFSFQSSLQSLDISFDQDKMERILFNLLSNAFKFTPEHGRIEVTLQLQPSPAPGNLSVNGSAGPRCLQLAVKDTGIGIAKDKQDKIFERWFQSDIPGSMLNQGSGIGLAITREFVKLHNGSIHVNSEPDRGSCFTVLLPVPDDAVPLFETPPAQEKTSPARETVSASPPSVAPAVVPVVPVAPVVPGTLPSHKKATILLVEDNEDFRFYLKDNLKEVFTILEASDGKEGWQKTLGGHPDLVVSDISMPEMNGIDLCRKIKDDRRTTFIPVILLTALTGEDQQLRGLKTGASDYMIKPFNFEILISKIHNLLTQQDTARKTWQRQVQAHPADISVESPDEKFVRLALDIVEKNISNPDFSVEEMSRALYLSRVALYKRILSLTGQTPIEFIRSIRLKRAAQLLEKNSFTIAEIAYEVGFNNPKYFSRYFKAEFGMLPSAYQRSVNNS
jgi:signal transduction histidine kinase/ligand-binding sensor domain-containing protein/DNA-binding response OmpR family regulator